MDGLEGRTLHSLEGRCKIIARTAIMRRNSTIMISRTLIFF